MKYKIVVDKQSRTNPSEEKREYEVDIEELRFKGDVYDSLVITKDEDYVMRRLELTDFYVLKELETPIKEPLENINIELFEGDNYIYLIDMVGNKFYAEYLLKNEFNDTYVIKSEMNTAIDQSAKGIELSVNQKLQNYSTTEEMNSAIDMKANEINTKVEKKVDEETITGAYLILKINGDTSEAKLNADKIELSANDILNLLAGNTINLGSKSIVIASDNFNVDKNGNVIASNIDITGGKINLKDDNTSSSYSCFKISNTDENRYLYIKPFELNINNDVNGNYIHNFASNGVSEIDLAFGNNKLELHTTSSESSIWLTDGNNNTTITQSRIITPVLNQTSLKSKKKNIKKLNVDAIELVKKADICLYNLKGEKKESKKHLGLVIGEGYNCPDIVISEDGQGIEQYSYTSLLYKAFQQLLERIEKLEAKNEKESI